MIRGHGGNIHELARQLNCSPSEIIDMSTNTNPLGPPPGLQAHIIDNMDVMLKLPEVDSENLIEAFSRCYGIPSERILAGNGTTQFIFSLPVALACEKGLILGPTYADYADSCRMNRVHCNYLMADETSLFEQDPMQIEKSLRGYDTVFICNPNNPTGTLLERGVLSNLCKAKPGTRFLIDESYLPFSDRADETTMMYSDLPNVMVLHSFSKIFCIPGLRLGFLIASPEVVASVKKYSQPWCVNSVAQVAGEFLLDHLFPDNGFLRETRHYIAKQMQTLSDTLNRVNSCRLFPGAASYALIKTPKGLEAGQVCSMMGDHRILLRDCTNFVGLSKRFVRVSLKGPEANTLLAERLMEMFS